MRCASVWWAQILPTEAWSAERQGVYAEAMTVYQAIGHRVAELRRGRGWTQEHLAERARKSAPYVARIEAGSRRPTIEVLAALAKALDVPLWRLFTSGRATLAEREWTEAGSELAKVAQQLDAPSLRLLAEVARRMVR